MRVKEMTDTQIYSTNMPFKECGNFFQQICKPVVSLEFYILLMLFQYPSVAPTDPPPPSCGGTLTSNRGEIRSPSYPSLYPSNSICTWVIEAPVGSAISLVFLDFDLQDMVGGVCPDDVDVSKFKSFFSSF